MEANYSAPVVASDQIDIDADPATVWGVISSIDTWPSWNPAIKTASLNGPLAEGTTFRWKAGPGTVTSTLRQVTPPQVLAWTGRTLGIKAVHVYRLEPREGGTVVYTAESWEGLTARLMRRSMQRQLENALRPGLERLKEESERRARSH